MTPRVSSKINTKTALLEAGIDIMLEKGYNNTGIKEVLDTLGVPKGSFYHYFDSKEDFGVELIGYYDDIHSANLMRVLRNPKEKPLERLHSYCLSSRSKFEAEQCSKGCLIGILSQEMSDQSEVLRKELSTVILKWRDMFAGCIEEGQKTGGISAKWPPDKMAELFLSGWAGASMRAKTMKNLEPIDIFMDLMFKHVLKS